MYTYTLYLSWVYALYYYATATRNKQSHVSVMYTLPQGVTRQHKYYSVQLSVVAITANNSNISYVSLHVHTKLWSITYFYFVVSVVFH